MRVGRDEMPSVKTALVVLGMHRSGTSALSGTLIRLFGGAPRTLMAADAGNELGYFESELIAALNDRVLALAGCRWDEWRTVRLDGVDRLALCALEHEAGELIAAEYDAGGPIVLKDPRICRIFPFWQRVLENSGYEVRVLMPLRSPLEVAASLTARDGFSRSKGLLLWLRHVLEAERDSRARPRTLLRWTDFLADWRTCLERAMCETGLEWSPPPADVAAEIGRFLQPRLHHHASPPQAADAIVGGWITICGQALDELLGDPQAAAARARLDALRGELDAASVLFEAMLAEADQRVGEAQQQAQAARAAQAAAEATLELVTRSTIWRATGPLRAVLHGLPRLRGLVRRDLRGRR